MKIDDNKKHSSDATDYMLKYVCTDWKSKNYDYFEDTYSSDFGNLKFYTDTAADPQSLQRRADRIEQEAATQRARIERWNREESERLAREQRVRRDLINTQTSAAKFFSGGFTTAVTDNDPRLLTTVSTTSATTSISNEEIIRIILSNLPGGPKPQVDTKPVKPQQFIEITDGPTIPTKRRKIIV